MTTLKMIDLDEALLVRAKAKASVFEALLSALAAGGCVGLLASQFVARPAIVMLTLVGTSVAYLLALRVKSFELRVTRSEFVSCGRIGDDFGTMRTVHASDIRWLEFQEDNSGPDTSHHPIGLYAVLQFRSICLLPHVDEQQTNLLIDRIGERFPDFRERWRGQSPFGNHFTALGLHDA